MASRVSPNLKCWQLRTPFSPRAVPCFPLRNVTVRNNTAMLPCRLMHPSAFRNLRLQRVKRACCSLLHDDDENSNKIAFTDSENMQNTELKKGSSQQFWRVNKPDLLEPSFLGIKPEPPTWPEREEILRLAFERKLNSVHIPLSIRMIKKKLQLQESLNKEASELSNSCCVKKAFFSMLFTIHELQKHAFETRECLCNEELEGVMTKLRREMDASFVWLFQKVFCKTPTLMVYLMVLLANFSVFSISNNTVMASTTLSTVKKSNQQYSQLDAEVYHDEDINKELTEEERMLWNCMVEEASILLQKGIGSVVLEYEKLQGFVAPVSVELEGDRYEEYVKTELYYKKHLGRMPHNSLLLSNYAHFLYLVVHDLDRAEEYYRRSVLVESPEAEAFSRYADFLWLVRKDNWAAEMRYLQALEEDPGNTYCSSKYASFLWSTGGQDSTSSGFPLEELDNLQI
ncbi:hypothetical protein RIF29_17516 [Crotalaria pallida]|uniref:Uncharacterized protein n=1 Tax=Crotalaria pallida TaxID=3830 RepID=A0AAN9FH60_CROPI